MKKIMLFAAFAAALTLSSCNKEAKVEAPAALRTVSFSALPTETKTVFGDKTGNKYPVLWTENDTQVGISLNLSNSIKSADVTPSDDGKTAVFSASFDEAESYTFVMVSPYTAFKSASASNRNILVEIPSGQTSTLTGPDPSGQVLVALTETMTELPENINVAFNHVTAYMHLSFKNVTLSGAAVQSVNVSTDIPISGRIHYEQDGSINTEGTGTFKNISVTTSSLDDVWFGIAPVDLSNKTLTFTISTDKGTLTKQITLPADRSLTSGKIVKFDVDMTDVPIVAPKVYRLVTNASQLNWGDRIIIVAQDYDFALSTAQNTNNRSATAIVKKDEFINDPSEAVEVIRLEDGLIPGEFAMIATGQANPGYLYAACTDGSSNQLKTKSTLDKYGSWEISIDTDGSAVIFNKASTNGLIRYNNSSSLFAAYKTSTSMLKVVIYRLDEPSVSHLAAIVPGSDNLQPYTGAELPLNIFGNVAWSVSATGGATLSSASGTGSSVVTITLPENTESSEKTYTITVSTTAPIIPNSIEITINQGKNASAAVALATWSFPEPGDNWVKGTDYDLVTGCVSGSYLYADEHKGKITVYRPGGAAVSNNPTYKKRSDVYGSAYDCCMLLHYDMFKGSYWQFDAYNVNKPAGEYTIEFLICASASGAGFYILEYSTDGTNWTTFGDVTNGATNVGDTTTYDYSFKLKKGSGDYNANEVLIVNKSASLPAITADVFSIRARVVVDRRASETNNPISASGTNRVLHHAYINFTAAE